MDRSASEHRPRWRSRCRCRDEHERACHTDPLVFLYKQKALSAAYRRKYRADTKAGPGAESRKPPPGGNPKIDDAHLPHTKEGLSQRRQERVSAAR
jgi:hypothetical protein